MVIRRISQEAEKKVPLLEPTAQIFLITPWLTESKNFFWQTHRKILNI